MGGIAINVALGQSFAVEVQMSARDMLSRYLVRVHVRAYIWHSPSAAFVFCYCRHSLLLCSCH